MRQRPYRFRQNPSLRPPDSRKTNRPSGVPLACPDRGSHAGFSATGRRRIPECLRGPRLRAEETENRTEWRFSGHHPGKINRHPTGLEPGSPPIFSRRRSRPTPGPKFPRMAAVTAAQTQIDPTNHGKSAGNV